VDNDAKLMTIAEHRVGAAKKFKNALCLTLGTGVGGGLIINGSLYRGNDNAAGELGHIPLNEDGPVCGCGGKACLERYVGNTVILKEAHKLFKTSLSLEKLSQMSKNNNIKAIKFWKSVGEKLGLGLSGIVNLLNLDVIVIGGGVSDAGKILFDSIKQTISLRAMSVQSKRVKIFKAKLGNDAGVIGAGLLVKEGLAR
jgi:glucokinase